MPILVVGGSNRGVGKTAFICGLIAALPQFRWTAVKITAHSHGFPQPIWEETTPGQESDTARYLAAGAQRAFLATPSLRNPSPVPDYPSLLAELRSNLGPGANLLFESNRILRHLKPDLCLLVHGGATWRKASFDFALQHGDAIVAPSAQDRMIGGEGQSKPIFHLASLERISPEMLAWLRNRLSPQPKPDRQ